MEENQMEKIVSLAKRRGFIYPGSEIYGGLAGTWDYGPLGVELKNNIKALWWRMFVQSRDDMYGMDAAIIMNPKAWEASGHVSGFSDPLVECKKCGNRIRVDHLMESQSLSDEFRQTLDQINTDIASSIRKNVEEREDVASLIEYYYQQKSDGNYQVEKKRHAQVLELLEKIEKDHVKSAAFFDVLKDAHKFNGPIISAFLNLRAKCNVCGEKEWGQARQFNMMFKTSVGALDDGSGTVYLRPETAGGMFVNFKNVLDSLHPSLPFGLGQIGKAFRNEIAPRDFIFRSREFEQMEVEYFVRPDTWAEHFEAWRKAMWDFIVAVGITKEKVSELEVGDDDRAHYSKRTIDFEFEYPFGKKELYGLAYRTDFDLKAHSETSTKSLTYAEEGEEAFIPHVIEPSFGVDRTVLAVLASAYAEDGEGDGKRVLLKLPATIAPIKAAVSPLLKNKPELVAKAREVYLALKKEVPQIMWDDNGNIGKRYRRQDEIGTPFCIVIDFDTLGEKPELTDTVTLRHRDTGEQERLSISDAIARVREATVLR